VVRRWFFAVLIVLVVIEAVLAIIWPPGLWSLVVLGPLALLGLHDVLQTKRTILRNFPLIGHFRYLFEDIRPEIQQYFIESNIDAHPIEREMRSIVYQRAKGELETKPFGTERDVYRPGYEWAGHALQGTDEVDRDVRVRVGSDKCEKPYDASPLNISAMSFGALSSAAVRALNIGAREGRFAHNTGEGGLSQHHLEPGADIIWQIGTGYFGCRTLDGAFDPDRFRDNARIEQVRMIEVKLSQGAKPGHGGVLPACKVTPEIAKYRGVPKGKTVISPPRHTAFESPVEMLEFLAQLRELSGGKPVGFKICIGERVEFLALCKAMRETGLTPDFITVDGGEGGTGAAPLEFSNSMGMPARESWSFVHNALVGSMLRTNIRVFASGKIFTGFHMVRAMALGADACYSARGFMLALGCIQALRCNTDACPTGVATQNPALVKGLVVADKSERVRRFHEGTITSFVELLGAMGIDSLDGITPDRIHRRADDGRVRTLAELSDSLEPGALVDGSAPDDWQRAWNRAQASSFAPAYASHS